MKLKLHCNAGKNEPTFGFDSSIEGTPKVCIALMEEMLKAMKLYDDGKLKPELIE